MIPQIAKDTASAYGCDCRWNYRGLSFWISDEKVTGEVRKAVSSLPGDQQIGIYPRRMTADDLVSSRSTIPVVTIDLESLRRVKEVVRCMPYIFIDEDSLHTAVVPSLEVQ